MQELNIFDIIMLLLSVSALIVDMGILYYVRLEFYYDKQKDESKQRRTRTTKKVTTMPTGEVLTEENVEVSETKGEQK